MSEDIIWKFGNGRILDKPIDLEEIVVALMKSRGEQRALSFRLCQADKGGFKMVVTAPEMDEERIAKYITSAMDYMSAAVLTSSTADEIAAALKEYALRLGSDETR